MPSIPHTIRLKSGVYKINLAIPKALIEAGVYGSKKKFVESLNTKDYHDASLRATIRAGEIKADFAKRLAELVTTEPIPSSTTNADEVPTIPTATNCRILQAADPVRFIESQLKAFFLDELREAESIIEELCTRDSGDTLEEMLELSKLAIDFYRGGKPQHDDLSELTADGKEILARFLSAKSIPYSDEGLQKVAIIHDKFRRALLEVENRRHARLVDTKRPLWMQGVKAWDKSHDPYFARYTIGTAPIGGNAGSVNVDSLADELLEKLQPLLVQSKPVPEVTLLELCDSYLEDQVDKGNDPKTVKEAKGKTVFVRALLGDDTLLHTIDMEAVRRLIDFNSALPSGITVGDDPIAYLNRINEKLEGDEAYNEQSPQTYENRWDAITRLFNHAVEHFSEAMPKNPAHNSKIDNYSKKMTSTGQKRGVKEFTIEELNQIFQQPLYTGHAPLSSFSGWKNAGNELDRKSGRYWAPLFMLFHGCRLNEIAQLMPEDVNVEAEIPYIRISPYQGVEGEVATPKRIKNKNSLRFVPIHPELIKCGFLEFVNQRRKEGSLWLFPEWVPKHIRNWKIGDPIPPQGRKHSDLGSDHCLKLYLTVLDEEQKPRPNSHSFRHGMLTMLSNLDVSVQKIERLLGWDQQRNDSMTKHYGEKIKLLKGLYNELVKVDFEGLDISHLYTEEHKPRRKRRRN